MMTISNYVPVAKNVLKLVNEALGEDTPDREVINLIAQALYSAYMDGVKVSNAQRELEEKITKRKQRKKEENDEYLKLYEQSMKQGG
jgi:hypothetical protein